MATIEQERLTKLITLAFRGINNELEGVVESKLAYKKALEKLDKSRKTYSPEHIEKEQSNLKANYDATRQEAYNEIVPTLKQLKEALTKKHAILDLENPAWENSLRLIELAGSNLDPDTVQKINTSFQFDQSALRALRTVYRAKGIDGRLDEQIYDLEPAFERLDSVTFGALVHDESLNSLSAVINKIAALEGIDFPKTIDEDAVDEIMGSAAGLT